MWPDRSSAVPEGAGIERLFMQNISGRLEYRYSDLSEGDGTFDRHRILAGIAYRF